MIKKIIIIIAIVMFLTGLSLVLYPIIMNYIYRNNTAREQAQYFERIENDPVLASLLDELYEYMRLYNIELYQNEQRSLSDPFAYSQPNFDISEYGIPDNCVGYVSIPSINIELPIYLGANKENMRKGSVHLTETSFPIGGENTNAVIAAHRGSVTEMFRNINKINMGDYILIKNFRETLTYQATETKIINPDDVHELLIQEGRDMITLISCHPLGQNYQRYVVYCERVG